MHTIHNIAFEVDVNYENSLVSWEQYYVDFFQERLLPRVERICDDWDKKHPNSKCVIDTIDIDVEVNNLNLETLQKEIIQKISNQLQSIQSDGSSSDGKVVATITKEASPFEGLTHYLQTGILPANISVKVFKEWLGTIEEFRSEEKDELRILFSTKTETIARMVSLLQNNYAKLAGIITSKQQITSQYIQLETSFFYEFLKEICTQYKLSFSIEEAKIWHKTLGFSSSLSQFSKTFLQLLMPKAQEAQKRLIKINETQLNMIVLQAITQYEIGKTITIDASQIAHISKDEPIKLEDKRTSKQQKTTSENKKTATEKTKNQSESKNRSKENTEIQQQKHSAKNDQSLQHTDQTTSNTTIRKAQESTENKTNNQSNSTVESNLSEEEKLFRKRKETAFSRAPIDKDLTLTTEKAGIILVHPFLSRFFKGVGLINENNEIDDVGKACMLLHYLATETEDVTDVELTLEKTLLGIPLETIINYQTPLTQNDKELCEELLKAVLEHWGVLKKSTINTLRDMFLKRDGELILTQKNNKLKIERAAQDILLDKIPWNISLVRLKWMEKMLHVEW